MNQSQTQQVQKPKPVKMTMKQKRMAREIKNYQESQKTFLPAATFRRLVSSVTEECVGNGIRFNSKSVKALQTAAEDEITTVFQGANILAHQAGRDTVTPLDVQTFNVLRKM
jgi:histone H3/H4